MFIDYKALNSILSQCDNMISEMFNFAYTANTIFNQKHHKSSVRF